MRPDPWKKEVRVNEALYQAVIPEIEMVPIERSDTESLWIPSEDISNSLLDEYLKSIVIVLKDIGQKFDDRFKETLSADYDVGVGFVSVSSCEQAFSHGALEWDEGEMDMFEKSMLAHGTNFRLFQSASPLSYRTVGELVEYYYKWKRTERHNAFRRRQRQPEEDYRQFATTLMANGSSKKDSGAWLGENLAKPQA